MEYERMAELTKKDFEKVGIKALPDDAIKKINAAVAQAKDDIVVRDLSCVNILLEYGQPFSERGAHIKCQRLFSK